MAAVFFFAQLDFVQGLSLPRLVGLLFFMKLFFSRASNLFFSFICLVGLLLFVKRRCCCCFSEVLLVCLLCALAVF